MIGALNNKTALVTGAGSGIGQGIAQVLAEHGSSVVVTDIDEGAAAVVAGQINGLPLQLDVSDRESVLAAVAEALRWRGGLDILVNNAGVAGNAHADVATDTEEDWDLTFEINVKGAVRCCQAVIPHLRERGAGSIVNIASVAAHAARRSVSPYAVSKSALLRYTTGLAVALAPAGIRVNAVCPGAVWSRFQQQNMTAFQGAAAPLDEGELEEAFLQRYVDLIPMGRVQTPDDVGQAASFLASDHARNITGQCLHVDGGMILRD